MPHPESSDELRRIRESLGTGGEPNGSSERWRPLKAAWKGYFMAALPDTPNSAQTIEARRAFYAGAVSTLDILLSGANGKYRNGSSSVQVLIHECEEFQKRMEKGEC